MGALAEDGYRRKLLADPSLRAANDRSRLRRREKVMAKIKRAGRPQVRDYGFRKLSR